MTVKSEIAAAGALRLREETAAAKRAVVRMRAETREVLAENSRLRKMVDIATTLDRPRTPPRWLAPTKAEGHHAIITTIFSDLHLDEVVNLVEVERVNKFDRRIAELRIKRYFDCLLELPRDYISNIEYDGLVIFAVGDTLSGEIHGELTETNAAPLQQTIDYWIDPMVAGLRLLHSEYKNITLVALAGNHGRNRDERRSPAKQKAARNWDPFFWKQVARYFADRRDITFIIPDSADCGLNVMGTRYRATHGDQFQGGKGIAGIFSPLMLGKKRKAERQQAVKNPFDVMVLGHFHQYISAASSGLIVNGSLKGYDEYAYDKNFNYEVAQQAMWLTTPEHGATAFHMPIVVEQRKVEKW